jgi:hypothetical protein
MALRVSLSADLYNRGDAYLMRRDVEVSGHPTTTLGRNSCFVRKYPCPTTSKGIDIDWAHSGTILCTNVTELLAVTSRLA